MKHRSGNFLRLPPSSLSLPRLCSLNNGGTNSSKLVNLILQRCQFVGRNGTRFYEQFEPIRCFFQFFEAITKFGGKLGARTGTTSLVVISADRSPCSQDLPA